MKLETEYWMGCYSGNFDLITPESFAHPAKMAVALCYKIIEHLEELGLLKAGMTILDPMSGTGLTGICANAKGYRAITIELEPKFIGFQQQNKEYAGRKLGKPLDWTILQGDSRKLSELLSEHCVTVTSPPYGDSLNESKNTTSNLKREERLRTAGHEPKEFMGGKARNASLEDGLRYSHDPNNIGNLPDRPLTVMSPPYDNRLRDEDREHHGGILAREHEKGNSKFVDSYSYGKNADNIGNQVNESYLSAMKQVYAEIAKVSDVCVVVTKNPTRNKKLRRLDSDTISLLQECGYRILCHHKAILFHETESQDLFGETHKKVRGRMSFFKRLSYQKGNAVAQWEDVIFAVKEGQSNLVTVSLARLTKI